MFDLDVRAWHCSEQVTAMMLVNEHIIQLQSATKPFNL